MNDGGYGRCYQPGKTKDGVNTDHYAEDDGVVVVGVAMSKLVGRMVDKMPGDSIVEEDKDECKHGRNCGRRSVPTAFRWYR